MVIAPSPPPPPPPRHHPTHPPNKKTYFNCTLPKRGSVGPKATETARLFAWLCQIILISFGCSADCRLSMDVHAIAWFKRVPRVGVPEEGWRGWGGGGGYLMRTASLEAIGRVTTKVDWVSLYYTSSVQFRWVQAGICALGKVHITCTTTVCRNFPQVFAKIGLLCVMIKITAKADNVIFAVRNAH